MNRDSLPPDAPRRSIGSFDLLIVGVIAAVLFGVGALLGLFDDLVAAVRTSRHLDDVLGLGVVSLAAMSIVAFRRSEQARRERVGRERAEAKYRALVEESPAVVYTWDSDRKRHVYVSPQIERLLGYAEHEWRADPTLWSRVIDERDRDRIVLASDEADRTRTAFLEEYRVRTRDGRVIWIRDESHYVVLHEGDRPNTAQGVMYDITAQKEAEALAAESEARFQTIVERVPAVAYVWDGADEPGQTSPAYISPQIGSILGVTPDEWLADPNAWEERVHPDDGPQTLGRWAEAVRNNSAFVGEYRMRRSDGSWVWVHDEAMPVREGERGHPRYQGVMFDVTERREAEDRLRDAEARWRTLLEQLPVTAYAVEYDVDDGTIHDRWIAPTITNLLGCTPEAWIADATIWIAHVHPDDRRLAERWWTDEVERGGTHDLEYRMVAEDGRIVWVNEEVAASRRDGRLRAEGVLIDVTARREAERALGAVESRLQALVEQLPAITYIEDWRTGKNIYISPQIEEIYGYTPAEWITEPDLWARCLHPDDREWVVASNEADNGDAWSVDYRSISRTGRMFWIHNEARLVRDDGGEPLYWLGLAFDITERKNAEVRVREAEERYRALVEQLPVAVYTDAVDDLSTALYISPRYEQLTGYSPEQRLLDPELWVRMLHPDDREAVLAESRRTNETGDPFELEYRIVAADGRTVWLRDHAVLVEAGGGAKIWQGVLQDVTERHVAQDALSRRDAILQATGFAAERFLRSSSWEETLDEVLARIGPAAQASRAYVVVNGEAGALTTTCKRVWRSAESRTRSPSSFEGEIAWAAAGLERWVETLGAGEPIHGPVGGFPDRERSALLGDAGDIGSILLVPIFVGERWWGSIGLDDCRGPRGWHDAEVDALTLTANTLGAAITREADAKELSETQRRYKTLVEQIPAMTYIEGADDGDSLYYSPQVHDVLGYAPDEWGSYRHWFEALHPDDRQRVVGEDRRTNETGEPFHKEYRLLAKDGHVVWVRDDAVLVRAADGTPVYWQGVRFDISAEKEAEAQLRAAEERYRHLVEQTPAITYLDERVGRDADDWRTTYISPQLERVLGYRPSEWMDDQDLWARLVHPDDAKRARNADLHHYRTGEPLDVEIRVRSRSGDIRWIRDQAVILRDDDGRPTWSQGIMLDVTERKEAEQALNDAEQRYRSLIETLPAVTYIDPIGDPLTTLYVSPQIETIFGYTREEWNRSDRIWRDRLHPDDRDVTEAAMTRHDATGEPLDVVYRFQHRDGHWLWVRDQAVVIFDENGEPRFSQGVMLDITATKTAEDRLREAEERYRGIVEHVPAAIYLDRPDGSAESIYVSPQIEDIVGVTPEQWIAEPDLWLRLMHPEDRPSVQRSYAEATAAVEPWSAEYRLQTPDGRAIWVHDEITFLHDEEGTPMFIQGVIFDVTERKLAEQALRESEQRERDAAERLRALDEMKNTFLAAVSHELRSPLTSILGLSLTLERAPDMRSDDRGELLRRLATNARKLDQLLKDLLDIDRLNRGIVEPQYRMTDIGALARRTIESLDALAGRDVIAETESVLVAVDPAKVERVVENLLMNAVRHTSGDRRIWLRVTSLDGGVLISVDDDGPGIAPELRDAIFEPFRQGPTASAHAPGTGIGLSLVGRFAELHGGRAWVDEREGGGASFRVFIPAQPDLVAAESA